MQYCRDRDGDDVEWQRHRLLLTIIASVYVIANVVLLNQLKIANERISLMAASTAATTSVRAHNATPASRIDGNIPSRTDGNPTSSIIDNINSSAAETTTSLDSRQEKKDDCIVFFHIPKRGGSTFDGHLQGLADALGWGTMQWIHRVQKDFWNHPPSGTIQIE